MIEIIKNIVFYYNYFFLYYFLLIGTIYIILSFLAFSNLKKYFNKRRYKDLKEVFRFKNFKSISLIVPAYNEETGIVSSVQALLQQEYPNFQIIVVNDGSTDNTLSVLKENFNAVEIPVLPFHKIGTEKINAVYLCKGFKNLILVDKMNGGKADAINAGIDISENDLVVVVDADSILERDCLLKISYPFVEDEDIVAVGGTVRVANGCDVNRGFITKIGLSKSWLAKFQAVEYLRAFVFGRNGLESLNGILIISGAFSCFRKNAIVEVGGFLKGCIGEDMEIIVRMHRILRKSNPATKISFVPDSICWTEAPENLEILKRQRKRWQKGTIASLSIHRKLLFNSKYGFLGMIVFPYSILFEMIGPLVEVFGYFIFVVSLFLGVVSFNFAAVFLCVAIFYGVILSLLSVIFEELTFRKYPKTEQLLELFVFAILENLGYRQFTSFCRVIGTIEYFLGQRNWGKMEKKGFS